MTKKKVAELSKQQRTNRNNKNRGYTFEKRLAKILGWHRVPYSGSNVAFGWCDIRDSETKDSGIWLGECKTMTSDNKIYTIKQEWLDKLLSRSKQENKMPILIFTMFGDSLKLVMMPLSLFDIINEICLIDVDIHQIMIERRSKNHKNYTIPRNNLKIRLHNNITAWNIRWADYQTNNCGWVIMRIEDYMKFYNDPNMNLVHEDYISIL